MVVTETWLHSDICTSEFCPPAYSVLRCDRTTRGGGVAIFHRRDLSCIQVAESTNLEAIFCKVKYGEFIIDICAVYRPPGSSLEVISNLNDFIIEHGNPSTSLILAGDFNLPSMDWENLVAGSQDRLHGEALLDLSFSRDLVQVVKDFTRKNQDTHSLLDLVFLSDKLIQCDYMCKVEEGISDHDMVIVTIPLNERITKQPQFVKVLDYEKADDDSILDHLESSFFSFSELPVCSGTDVEMLWLTFKNIINYCVQRYVPIRKKKTNTQNPWINRDILHLKRRISRLRRSIGFHDSESSRSLLATLNLQFKKLIVEARRRFYNSTLRTFFIEAPQKFWRYLTQRKREIPAAGITADALNMAFESVFTMDDGIVPEYELEPSTGIENIVLTESGIFNLLNQIDIKKSSGPDSIDNMFLKRYAEPISRYLYVIFDASLRLGSLPSDWKTAKIIPIHKTGDRNDGANYRPISLTSTVCKTLEHIVSSHIRRHFERYNILNFNQHGFRAGLSTVTQLVEVVHNFATEINNRGQTDVIFLDYSKAFDRVCHSKLINKLSRILKNDQITNWLSNYLTNRTQYVEYNGETSRKVDMSSGVPQGSVLGPLLFLTYVNDICTGEDVQLKMFADDCIIYTKVCDERDQLKLNNALQEILNWSNSWQMNINFEKTVVMTIHCKKHPLMFAYNVSGKILKRVNEYKYLGLTINSKLNWNQHIENTIKKARCKLFFLRRTLKYANSETKLIAYNSLVRSVLEYANVIWFPYTKSGIESIEKVQRLALRFIYNQYDRKVSLEELRGRGNIQLLVIRAQINRLKFLFNIINGMVLIDKRKYITWATGGSTRLNNVRAIKQYPFRNNCFRYSFFPRAIEDWNKLPNNIVSISSPQQFVNSLDAFF